MTISLAGKPVADALRTNIISRIAYWKERNVQPRIITILVEGDPASRIYAEQKARAAKRLGIDNELLIFPSAVTAETLRHAVQTLGAHENVHGIMVELPLPPHIPTAEVVSGIPPHKDVDGLLQVSGQSSAISSPLYPATPTACIRLLTHYGISLSGKDVVLVGCGKTVGMPLFHLLIQEQATVTACHAGTRSLSKHLHKADIAFVAVGRAGLITPDMVHPNLVIVDAGINETNDGAIVGDVHPEVSELVQAISPTPGGVGRVTTMQLFDNLLTAIEMQHAILQNPATANSDACAV